MNLAEAGEVARYARPETGTAQPGHHDATVAAGDLAAVRDALWSTAPRWTRWRARLLPGSVVPVWLRQGRLRAQRPRRH
jgi:hypothetical protein